MPTTPLEPTESHPDAVDAAVTRAAALLHAARAAETPADRDQARRLAALLDDPAGRDLLLTLTDVIVRIRDPKRAARAVRNLVRSGLPVSLPAGDRRGLQALAHLSRLAPRTTRRLVDWRVAKDTAGVILPASDPQLAAHLATRNAAGFTANVNVLGEAITSREQADARLEAILTVIARPDVAYVSVKASAIVFDLDPLAHADAVDRIADRLRTLYRAGRAAGALVTLDMEEFRDLACSVDAFCHVLAEPEFTDLTAGIVLQAYLPDTHAHAARLIAFAQQRVDAGGAPVRVRLVKGANLAAELVEAELHGWVPAPYPCKEDVDASYKRLLDDLLAAGPAVRIGVASHNLFDIAWAFEQATALGAADRVEFEMLEGMAPAQADAVRDMAGGLLLYTPIAADGDWDSSIAYLSRRLDENAAPENFLHAALDLEVGSPAWAEQESRFRQSVAARNTVSTRSRRFQDRRAGVDGTVADGPAVRFENCPDTDMTVAANRAWLQEALARVDAGPVPVCGSIAEVDAVIAQARTAGAAWASVLPVTRRALLDRLVSVMEADRARTCALLAAEVGKPVREGDPEVSEAVDFVSYAAWATHAVERRTRDGMLVFEPWALTAVAGPWNFPYAIPMCGVVNAVAAGGAVVLKPAPQARAVGQLIVDQFARAGFPEHLVSLAATDDDVAGRHLITTGQVDRVVLTGSGETADLFRSWRPKLRLSAETSGKNAVLVTAAADLDQAVRDVVRSAFGYAGQKCSAASLVLVEASVHDDGVFLPRLAAAVRSLQVGPAKDPRMAFGPLTGPLTERLERALTRLDASESWLVEPREVSAGVWTPGVRVGVQPGSWLAQTEVFGPVLGVVRVKDLDEALEVQNGTVFGLTGGIASLDPREVDAWLAGVQVGNAYVNRPITGAVVSRQPFGGWKASTVGVTGKPGGPHHLDAYGRWMEERSAVGSVENAEVSFPQAWGDRFAHGVDEAGLECEANVLRYVPVPVVLAVAHTEHVHRPVLALAASTTGVELRMMNEKAPLKLLCSQIKILPPGSRVRALMPLPDEAYRVAAEAGVPIDDAPVTSDGLTELPHWLMEQAVSVTRHRHGRILGDAFLPGAVRVAGVPVVAVTDDLDDAIGV